MLLGCRVAAPRPEQPAPDPEAAALAAHRSRLPDSLFVRHGVCPFECCAYGEWTALDSVPLVDRARGSTRVGTIPTERSFEALTGTVFVTGLQLVVVSDSLDRGGYPRPAAPAGPEQPVWEPALFPGDTLVLLDYMGEGYFRLWRSGSLFEAQQFWEEGGVGSLVSPPAGHGFGDYDAVWWVRARAEDGLEGWFRPSDSRITGADLCG